MLDHSREFIVLAQCLNYTLASGRLNVSQSSLSRHIADLERQLGFQLFERNPLTLTSAGRYYMESVSEVIERLDAIVDHGRLMAKEGDQTISVYMLPSDGLYASIVYESVTCMRREQAGFSPRFQYNDRMHTVFDAVRSGKADVGILLDRPVGVPEGLACEWLVDSPVTVWLHEDNPVLRSPDFSFEDLVDCYLVRSTNQSSQSWFDGMAAVFRAHGLEPNYHLKDLENKESFFLNLGVDEVVLESDSGETVCRYNSHLVAVRFSDPVPVYPVHLLYRAEPMRPVVASFVEACRRTARERQGGAGEARTIDRRDGISCS